MSYLEAAMLLWAEHYILASNQHRFNAGEPV